MDQIKGCIFSIKRVDYCVQTRGIKTLGRFCIMYLNLGLMDFDEYIGQTLVVQQWKALLGNYGREFRKEVYTYLSTKHPQHKRRIIQWFYDMDAVYYLFVKNSYDDCFVHFAAECDKLSEMKNAMETLATEMHDTHQEIVEILHDEYGSSWTPEVNLEEENVVV